MDCIKQFLEEPYQYKLRLWAQSRSERYEETIEILKAGETKEIELTFEPETTTVDISKINYSSSDSKVAIVDADGKIVALKEGTATITISIDDITTITKVTVEKSEEEKTAETPKEKSNTGSIFLAVIITFVVTLILVFVVSSIKRRKEVNNIDEDNDFKMNKYM